LAAGLVSDAADPLGQASFWMLGSVASPRSWFRDIFEFAAGSWASIDAQGELSGPHVYWDISDSWSSEKLHLPASELRERVRQAVLESVKYHLIADVPIGVFLSGGIDSSALAALMVEAGAKNVIGITIKFKEFRGSANDEAPLAARVAQEYGIKHVVRTVTREEFEADFENIMASMDQPSIDGINTWYASKAVSEIGLKVVISGVGGDELFLGYPSFKQLPALVVASKAYACLPGLMWLGDLILRLQAHRSGNPRWRNALKWSQTIFGAWWLRRSMCAPEELFEFMDVLEVPNIKLTDSWLFKNHERLPKDSTLALAQIETMMYLKNQLLRDSDWASMAHGVEVRMPLVDAHLLKTLAPLLWQFKRYPGKSLLAGVPLHSLPHEVIRRKKTGFGIPIQQWISPPSSSALVNARGQWHRLVASEYGNYNSKLQGDLMLRPL
jgi:asparagine synthase (glutamine-hydrolysing)